LRVKSVGGLRWIVKAVKKPIAIDVMEWTEHSRPPATVLIAKARIVSKCSTMSVANDGWKVYNGLHNCWICFNTGDFLNITLPGDVYPIARSVFQETYDVVED
jgi:hypothetical protein